MKKQVIALLIATSFGLLGSAQAQVRATETDPGVDAAFHDLAGAILAKSFSAEFDCNTLVAEDILADKRVKLAIKEIKTKIFPSIKKFGAGPLSPADLMDAAEGAVGLLCTDDSSE